MTFVSLLKGGVSLGHRLQLLRTIADLSVVEKGASKPAGAAAASTPKPIELAPIPITVAPPTVSAALGAGGERRYLTVMFCDLVGSTGISGQLDAEEWRDLVGAYLDTASAAVTEMGGHVAKKLGKGDLLMLGAFTCYMLVVGSCSRSPSPRRAGRGAAVVQWRR
jgi:hypothetical protein